MKNYRVSAHDSFKITNKTLRGLDGYISITAAATNNALVNTDIVLNNILITATLHRVDVRTGKWKEPLQIVGNTLRNAMAGTNFRNQNFNAAVLPITYSRVDVAVASGVAGVYRLGINVNFQGVIDLQGEDYVEVDVNFQSGAVTANVNSALTNLNIDALECVGTESFTPYILIDQIQAAVPTWNTTCGKKTKEITYVNFDLLDETSADQTVNSVTIHSKTFSSTITRETSQARQIEMFENYFGVAGNATITERHQSFMPYGFFEKELLDDCRLEWSLVSANITAGNNIVVSICHMIEPDVVVKGHAKAVGKTAATVAALGKDASTAIANMPSPAVHAARSHGSAV